MRTKTPQAFRLSDQAVEALELESKRTGKPKVGVVEDLLLWRRLFSDEAEKVLHSLAQKHNLPERKVIEVALLKASGNTVSLPFSHLAAA